ncbi:predicted protein [Arabidopsis lyrata subsp. lyrata]|uniref:Predicted protein n=1 Tax=Arabidopsis lyrata subsp. lyrata TaxID=81972 RepID=D7M6A3_ARALL|nr:predicted protein [Arabidopsis lyrata subsp. lyrata]
MANGLSPIFNQGTIDAQFRLQVCFLSLVAGGISRQTLNKIDEPFNVEEVESVHVPPTPTEKLLVLGGNGFVGSHICKEALDRGLSVSSLSR